MPARENNNLSVYYELRQSMLRKAASRGRRPTPPTFRYPCLRAGRPVRCGTGQDWQSYKEAVGEVHGAEEERGG
jgi:hypothetical protein